MLRATVSVAVMLALGPLTGCHPTPAPQKPSPASSSPRAVASPDPAPPDQSTVFFPGDIDTYGLDLTGTDHDHLAELYALRHIDTCGFVPNTSLAAGGHPDFSYRYTAKPWIETGANSPIEPYGGEGCVIAFPSTSTGIELALQPGEPHWADTQFSPDPEHPDVLARRYSPCTYRVTVPLTRLRGAPASMRDPLVQVSPTDIADGRAPRTDDPALCDTARQIAIDIATQITHTGIPTYPAESSPAARLLTSDPCAAAPELQATGIAWNEPKPVSQWPTTWRHPGVCNLHLEATPATTVVKRGLVAWSDAILDMPWGEDPQRSEHDGVALFDYNSYLAPGCLVLAKPTTSIDPVSVGRGAPDLGSATPLVTVRINGAATANCLETAHQVALNTVKRAT